MEFNTSRIAFGFAVSLTFLAAPRLEAQAYGQPDRGQPGDAMIQSYLAARAAELDARLFEGIKGAGDWQALRPRFKGEYLYMLGLWPTPPRTPLEATVTRTISGQGFAVDMIHFQSRPHLYVTGNLYRPERAPAAGERLPAVLYVCGHAGRGRNGNKTAFQSHGIWFARHGYICLAIDTLQLGEIGAIHHGTYRENRWWWHSRGYTPAGVECWNGIRAIDYLASRPDVDPERIAVTGISGGGAATFWIAAADERARVAVPVSGMADLESYVGNRVINGHCDCMFLYNTFEWPWSRIAALIAPRPFLFVNSDADAIFPMDANERITCRMERFYSLFGASDIFDTLVSVGGHAYRADIRRGVFRFINAHLKGDARPVTDSEVDLVVEEGGKATHPIPPEQLRVFATDADLPKDELNTTIDRHFVPMAQVPLPEKGAFAAWKEGLLKELRRVSFRHPETRRESTMSSGRLEAILDTGITVVMTRGAQAPTEPRRTVLAVLCADDQPDSAWVKEAAGPDDALYLCHVRGTGETRWTTKNPPNYVARSHALLGLTADTGRVWDIIAVAGSGQLREAHKAPLFVAGRGAGGILAAYAALLDETIGGAILLDPPASHMDQGAPQFLNALRVCDIPDVLGMLAPRPLTLKGAPAGLVERVRAIYGAADSPWLITSDK